jgi:hypothetical protein
MRRKAKSGGRENNLASLQTCCLRKARLLDAHPFRERLKSFAAGIVGDAGRETSAASEDEEVADSACCVAGYAFGFLSLLNLTTSFTVQ